MKNVFRKYEFFKTTSWARNIVVENFLGIHVTFLKHSACWPINFKGYLPKPLQGLDEPLKWSYFLGSIFISFHLMILFIYSFIYNVAYAENVTLAEISDCLTESIIYAFTFCSTCYYHFRHDKCKEIVSFMNNNFKMRSAIGKFFFFLNPSNFIVLV